MNRAAYALAEPAAVSRRGAWRAWVAAAVVLALATEASRALSFSEQPLSLWWPAAGMGLAFLARWGWAGLWPLAGGLVLWVVASAGGGDMSWGMLPWVVAAGVVGSAAVWGLMGARLLEAEQPYLRRSSLAQLLIALAFVAAPLAATLGMAGLKVNGGLHPNVTLLGGWVAYWTFEMCGALVVGPLAWNLLCRPSAGFSMRARLLRGLRHEWLLLAGVLALALVAGGVMLGGADLTYARALLYLMLPLLALAAIRAKPLAAYATLLVGVVILTSTLAYALHQRVYPGVDVAGELVLISLYVVVAVGALHGLLAASYEQRLAQQQLERQAFVDADTGLLNRAGLARWLNGGALQSQTPSMQSVLGDVGCVLASVKATNAPSLRALRDAHELAIDERQWAQALQTVLPNARWARVSSLRLVATLPVSDSVLDLDTLATQLNAQTAQSAALTTQPLHRPTWAVAVLGVPRGARPSAEVLLNELAQLEQRAAQSRQPVSAHLDVRAAQRQLDDAAQAQRLRAQLMAGDVLLYAQPIVGNAAGAAWVGQPEARPLRKVEVLLRMSGPRGEVLSPAVFMPVAMRHNLMPLLDQVVIEQTFAWFSRHPQALAQLGLCCINLSGSAVGDSETARRIVQLLQQHGLNAHQFLFEVTESQAIANPAQARDTVAALRAAGCRIAIDDFGTGQATYDYLKRYPVDFIKIDGSFVQTLADDPVDRVIVESMVRVARQLGVGTVAEFVSSAELQRLVASLGVDESQGYALGAPQPLAHWFDAPLPSSATV